MARAKKRKPVGYRDRDLAELKVRVERLRLRLSNPDQPVFNPVYELRVHVLGITATEASILYGCGVRQYYTSESGGTVLVPGKILNIVLQLLGAEGKAKFEKAWDRYRKNLSAIALEMIRNEASSPDPGQGMAS